MKTNLIIITKEERKGNPPATGVIYCSGALGKNRGKGGKMDDMANSELIFIWGVIQAKEQIL